MRFPRVPNHIRHYKRDVLRFGGLNLTTDIQDGEFSRTLGVTTSNFPYITQVPDLTDYVYGYDDNNNPLTWTDPYSMCLWDGVLYVVQGNGDVYKGGILLGNIGSEPDATSMVVINTKLVIFPDKYYIDLTDDTLHSLINKTWTGSVTFTEDTDGVTISATGIGADFVVGDVLDVEEDDIKAKVLTVTEVNADSIKVTKNSELSRLISVHSGDVTVMSSVPDMSFVCASNNRLWGVDGDTIYASALGDPTDFFTYGTDAGAYTVSVSTDDDFNAICEYGGAVCCWKSNVLHKILGSYPSEYYMTTQNIPGVGPSCHNSLVTHNGLLYYVNSAGVWVYGGNRPQCISDKLFRQNNFLHTDVQTITEGCACAYGSLLYVSVMFTGKGDMDVDDVQNDPWPSGFHLLVYDLLHGLWVNERDNDYITKMVPAGEGGLSFLFWNDAGSGGGTNKIMTYENRVSLDRSWMAEMVEVTEDTFNRKGYTRLNVRLDMAYLSKLTIYAKEDRRPYRKIWEKERCEKGYFLDPTEIDFSNIAADYDFHFLPHNTATEDVYATMDGVTVKCTIDTVLISGTYLFRAIFPEAGRRIDLSFNKNDEPHLISFKLREYPEDTVITNETHTISFWKVTGDSNPVTMLVPIRLGRCDRYQIKFEGAGRTNIRGIEREFVTGSVK